MNHHPTPSIPPNMSGQRSIVAGPVGSRPSDRFARFLALRRKPLALGIAAVIFIAVAGSGLAFYLNHMSQHAGAPPKTTDKTTAPSTTGVTGSNGSNGSNGTAAPTPKDDKKDGAAKTPTPKTPTPKTDTPASTSNGGNSGNDGTGGSVPPPNNPGSGLVATCPALPAFPDANCTGWQHTGVTLTTVTSASSISGVTFDPDGNMLVNQNGKVIDSIKFNGCIFVKADNVTIKRSLLTRGWCAEGTISAQLGSYVNITIADVEIDGQNQDNTYSGVSGNNFTCTRCNIHNVGTPIRAATNVTVTDSYLHDNAFGGSSHNTGMSMHEGGNVLVQHSTIRCDAGANCSGAFEINSRDSYVNTGVVINNVTLQQNLLYSSTGYCLYGGWDSYNSTPTHATNIKILDNAFMNTTQYGKCGDLGGVANWADTPQNAAAAGNVWTGNYTYPNTGSLISPY